MRFFSLTIVSLLIPAIICYDSAYDMVDVDNIIADEALFSSYISCLLDKGPCTPEHSSEFKKVLPEIIKEACGKCTPIQKQNVRKIVKIINEKRPEDAAQIQEKYDPKREYESSFAAFVLASE